MPRLVKDLTPLQRMWLYEHQRTLSDETGSSTSVPEGDERTKEPHNYVEVGVTPLHKGSIFRERPSVATTFPLPSSSPSWEAHRGKREFDDRVDVTPGSCDIDKTAAEHDYKRRKVAYPAPYHSNPPSYYEYQPYNHHYHHPRPYYYPPAHPPPPPPESMYQNYSPPRFEPRTPRVNTQQSKAEHREEKNSSPSSTSERFPTFPHDGKKLTWMESFENLQAYKNHYGDCNVPQKYKGNTKLGGWVNKQRKKYRNPSKYGTLKKEHVKMLEDLGFKWQ